MTSALLLLGTWSSLTFSAAPALVLQRGHEASIDHLWVLRRAPTPVLFTRSGRDVRLWRGDGSGGFELLHEFLSEQGVWSHFDRGPWFDRFLMVWADGRLRVVDYRTLTLRLDVVLSLPDDPSSSNMWLSGPTGKRALLSIDALDDRGEHATAFFLQAENGSFARWAGPPGCTASSLVELGPGEAAFGCGASRPTFLALEASGRSRPLPMPARDVTDFTFLSTGLVALRLEKGWALAKRTPTGWVDALPELGMERAEVASIESFGQSVVRIVLHGTTELAERARYFSWREGALRALEGEVPGVGSRLRNFVLHADESVLGARAAGRFGVDAHEQWTWRMKDGERWVELSGVLRGAPASPETVVTWAFGDGVGVRGPGARAPWIWFLRHEDHWSPVQEVLSELAGLYIVQLQDVRSGLVVATVRATPTSRDDHRYFFRGSDGKWRSVRDAVARLWPGNELRVLSAEARDDGLALTVEWKGGGRSKLFAWLDGNFDWQRLDEETLGARVEPWSGGTPRGIARSELVQQRVLVLAEASSRQHVFTRAGVGWVPLAIEGAHYDPARGLLVRTEPAPTTFFLHRPDGSWLDVRQSVESELRAIDRAYSFADGEGLALEVKGRWHFRVKAGEQWRPLESLGTLFPKIRAVSGNARVISVEEEGDSDGDGLALEAQHFVHVQGRWQPLVLPGLPELDDVWLEDDLLLARLADRVHTRTADERRVVRLWSPEVGRFLPLTAPELGLTLSGPVFHAQRVFSGAGLLVEVRDGDAVTVRLLERDGSGVLKRAALSGAWREGRAGTDPRVIAMRGEQGWVLHCRTAAGAAFVPCGRPAAEVRFDRANPVVFVRAQTASSQWERRALRGTHLEDAGKSVGPWWWGANVRQIGALSVAIDGASHVVDGVPAQAVPRPVMWVHRNAFASNDAAALYAPELLERWLGPGAELVEAVGLGNGSTVVVSRFGKRLVVVSSSGSVKVELLRGAKAQAFPLLVAALSGGVERLSNLAQPERWLLRATMREGRIWFEPGAVYYSDSEAAARHLRFRVGADLFRVTQLGAYLFRPTQLEHQLGVPTGWLFTLTPRDRLRDEGARKLAASTPDVSRLVPPRVEVVLLPTQAVASRTIRVSVSGQGLRRDLIDVQLLGRGALRGSDDVERDTPATIVFTRTFKALPGLQRLEVVVNDAQGLSTSTRLEVEGPPATGKPRLFAALVASTRYSPEASLAPLPLTQNDLDAMKAVLHAQEGRQFSQVSIRGWCQAEGCDAPPTRSSIEQGVAEFFTQLGPGDYALLYVSGHGVRLPEGYFAVPADGLPKQPSTMLGWSTLQSLLQRTGTAKKVLLLDTCHAGAVFEGQEQHALVQQAAELDGVYVLTAAAADASAFEFKDLGGGVFTTALVEGLRGAADQSGDGAVSFEELAFFAGRRVRELSTARGVRMDAAVPVLDAALDFELSRSSGLTVALHVSDVSTFDATPHAGRAARWTAEFERAQIMVASGPSRYRLSIVEDQGLPLRAQLATSTGSLLEQWSPVPNDLAAQARRVLEGALSRTRGCSARSLSVECR